MTGSEILNLKMAENDANAETVIDYLKALLSLVWGKGECFSGKRPFGNSGWDCELKATLVMNGVIDGDEDGRPVDDDLATNLIFGAIEALRS